MGKAPKDASQRGGKRKAAAQRGGQGYAFGSDPFKRCTTGSIFRIETRPIGRDGPQMRIYKRASGLGYVAPRGFWLLFSLGCLSTAGLTLVPTTLTHWSWLLFAALDVSQLACHVFGCTWLETLLVFWCLPPLHGLLWCQLVLLRLSRGALQPSALHDVYGPLEIDGSVAMAELGSPLLLYAPLAALLAYMYSERSYLLAVFCDIHTQFVPLHRACNCAWHLASPLLPLCAWAYWLNPTFATDLPLWEPKRAPLLAFATSALVNGALYTVARRRALAMRAEWGLVRWLQGGQGWVMWSKREWEGWGD